MSEPILKLPLRCDGQEIWDASKLLHEDGQPIASASGDSLSIAKLRAREIVRRCNAFDALLAACKTAMRAMRHMHPNVEHLWAEEFSEIKDAASAAEKEVS